MAEGLVGIIGGSGLGDELAGRLSDVESCEVKTPFGRPSCAILIGKIGGGKVAFLNRHGDGHKIGPSEVPYAANIFALKKLGVRSIIASAAVGSLREEIRPKDVVIVDQFIDKTFRRQGSFFAEIAAAHCEMAEPVCGRLGGILAGAAKEIDIKAHRGGTYVCMEGPQFSTKAESLMHRGWGGDLIGMTAMPEAKLAREAQICYAMVALASDYDCWREHDASKDKQSLLDEIIGNLQEATGNALRLIEKVLAQAGELCDDGCGCRKSLEIAVWTRPDAISAEDRKKLSTLFE